MQKNNLWFKLLIAAAFMMQFGAAAGTIGIPILAKKLFDASFWGLAMIGMTGTLVYSVVCFVIGGLVKRVDPYRMMMAGTFFFAAAFIFAIFASAVWHLLLIYVVAGAAAAFFWPMLEAALVHGAQGEAKNKRIGVFNISWSLADALGTAIAGGLYLLWPRLPFLLLILFLSAVFILSLLAGRLAKREQGEYETAEEEKSGPADVAPEIRQGFANAAWTGNFVAHGITGILRSVFTAPAVDVFKMSPLGIGLAIGTFNAVRTLTFIFLRQRNDWAYNKKVFSAAHLVLAAGMLLILLAAWIPVNQPSVVMVFVGLSLAAVGCGVIYYSSIYYSVNLSREVASHTRLHEAYLGAGATGMVMGAGGFHWLLISPSLHSIIVRAGADPFILSNLSPFILAALAVSGALGISRGLFLKKM